MGGLGAWKTLSVAIVGSTAGYSTALSKASAETKAFGRQVDSTLAGGSKSWASFGTVAAGGLLVLGAALVGAGLATRQFDQNMRNVYSLGSESMPFGDMEKQVISLSKTFPQSAATIANGLYDIESSGFSGSAALDILRASLTAASAGMTDTATSARAVVGVMNAYGGAAGTAKHVSDLLFQVVNDGVITFGDLAQNLGTVIPAAAAIHVPLEDVGSAIATITLAGMPAAEATTALGRVFTSFLKPSDALQNALHNLGYESGTQALQTDGLRKVMQKLWAATGKTAEGFQTLFPNIRSTKGAMALLTQDGATWNRVAADMAKASDGAGAATKAFKIQMQGLSDQMKIVWNNVMAFVLTVGVAVIPVLSSLASGFLAAGHTIGDLGSRLSGAFGNIEAAGKSLVTVLEALWRGAEPVAKAFGAIAGTAIVGSLSLVAAGLKDIAGFLASNEGAIRAFGTALAVYGTARLLMFAGSLATTGVVAFGAALENLTVGALPALKLLSAGVGTLSTDFRLGAGMIRQSMSGVGAALNSPIVGLAALVVAIGGPIGAYMAGTKAADGFLTSVNQKIQTGQYTTLDQVISSLGDQLDDVHRKALHGGGITGFFEGWGANLGNMVTFGHAFKDAGTTALGNEKKLSSAMTRIKEQVSSLSGTLGMSSDAIVGWAAKLNVDLTKLNPEQLAAFGQKIGDMSAAAAAGTPVTDALGTSFTTLADATASASDKLDAFKSEMDAIIGVNVDAFDAQTKFVGTMTDLAATLAKNGTAFDTVSVASRANRDALGAAAKQAEDFAAAIGKRDGLDAGIAALGQYRDALSATLHNAGMTDAQVQALLTDLGLTDAQFAPIVETGSVDGAKKAAKELAASLDSAAQPRALKITGLKDLAAAAAAGNALAQLFAPAAGAVPLTTEGKTSDLSKIFGGLIDPPKGKQQAGGSSVTTLSANIVPLGAAVAAANKMLHGLIDPAWVSTLDANAAPATASIGDVERQGQGWGSSWWQAVVDADAGPANANLAGAWAQGWGWASSTFWSTVDANTGPANAQLAYLDAVWNNHQLAWFANITANVTSIGTTLGKSRWGNVFSYAQGGISQAQIAAGTRYKWAEPETGGEAFIPRLGDPIRSKKILAAAAGWYGMAVVPQSGSAHAGVTVNLAINGNVSSDIDMTAHMERFGRDLSRKLAKL